MNPDTNRFEELSESIARRLAKAQSDLLRPNGEPVPQHWTQFSMGEHVVIKNYTFKVGYIGETSILFEPVGPIVIGGPPSK
jgi:hypothetical protein